MRKLSSILLLFFSAVLLRAQNTNLDSLEQVFKASKHDTTRCIVLNNLIESEDDAAIWSAYNVKLKEISLRNIGLNNKGSYLYVFFTRYYANSLNNDAVLCQMKSDGQNALKLLKKSLLLQEDIGDKRGVATALSNIGSIYVELGVAIKAIEYNERSLVIQKEINDTEGIANSMQNIASIYSGQGKIKEALDYFHEILRMREKLKDDDGIGQTYTSIANIYLKQNEYNKAIEFYEKCLEINLKSNDINSILNAYNNLCFIALKLNRNEEAFNYLNKSAGLSGSADYKRTWIYLYRNWSWYYSNINDLIKSSEYALKSLEMAKELNDSRGMIDALNRLGINSLKFGKINDAENYYQRSLVIAKEIGYPEYLSNIAINLKEVYSKLGKYKDAMEMGDLYRVMHDSIVNNENRQAGIRSQFQVEFDKREIAIKEKTEFEKRQLELKSIEDRKRKNLIIYSVAAGLVLVLIFSVFILRALNQNRRANKIILAQKEEVEQKNLLIEEKQKEILDSIAYAKRLQEAILPPQEFVNKYLPENFLLYKPKDIVAGDFYWFEHIDDATYLAAADSTGHGVPGALVSVVCSNALNRAVNEFGLRVPGDILDKTRELVLETFSKSDKDVKDGMDISLIKITEQTEKGLPGRLVIPKGKSLTDVLENNRKFKIEWAGANNPLWYLQNRNINEISAHKQPIGKTENPTPFPTHTLELNKGDMLYLFTDGYADQFGGPKGKKFKYKQLEELLLENSGATITQQKEILDLTFIEWIGNLEQIDDVTIIGVRL